MANKTLIPIPLLRTLQLPGNEDMKKATQKLSVWLKRAEKGIDLCWLFDEGILLLGCTGRIFKVDPFGLIRTFENSDIDNYAQLRSYYDLKPLRPAHTYQTSMRELHVSKGSAY